MPVCKHFSRMIDFCLLYILYVGGDCIQVGCVRYVSVDQMAI